MCLDRNFASSANVRPRATCRVDPATRPTPRSPSPLLAGAGIHCQRLGRLAVLLANVVLLAVGVLPMAAEAQTRQQFAQRREAMVREAVEGAGVTDRRVIRAMTDTPRHEFVSAQLRQQAYYDMALPIGDKQTISSPFIVAFMTQSLDPKPTDKVLEIGTGSGYQAAVLSPLVKSVYSIEIVPSLGRRAARTLDRLKYKNVFTKVGDGFQGWAEHAPFDKIIVTCSPERVPLPLVQQLREGGLIVVPVGQRYQQTLYLLEKKNGKLESKALRSTLFVPMTGRAEANRRIKPDPSNPEVANGGFEEEPKGENNFVPGWYYQRQLKWETDSSAPEGGHFISFQNKDAGRAAHLLQGFAIDGRTVNEIEVSAQVKSEGVTIGRSVDEFATVAVTFYDSLRKEVGVRSLGPIVGTEDWYRMSKQVRVPPTAREGILRIGLFGATGTLSFDDVRIRK